jgi:hypothetical protein
MFELRSDIPAPVDCPYPWDQMEVGQCLVFAEDADFKAARKSARSQRGMKFICRDLKIWLIEKTNEANVQLCVLEILDKHQSLSEGVLTNKLRRFSRDSVLAAIGKLVKDGKVEAIKGQHRFNGRIVVFYEKKGDH